MRFFTFTACLLLSFTAFSQKKAIDHLDVQRWQKIDQTKISNNGLWVSYTLNAVTEGDPVLHLWNSKNNQTLRFPRSTDARFTDDNEFLVFRIKPALDSLKTLRRKKVKDDDLPKDTLAIYQLSNGTLQKIPRLRNVTVPEKWAGFICYQLDPAPPVKTKPVPADSAATKPAAPKNTKKPKKEDKENGYRLYVYNTQTNNTDTFAYVLNYNLAKRGKKILLNTTGKGDTLLFPVEKSTLQNGVYAIDLEKNEVKALYRGKGKFQQLSLDEWGKQAAFISDTDSSKARIRPWMLRHWNGSASDSARVLVDQSNPVLEKKYLITENTQAMFSEDGQKLYFGMAPPPILNDTTLLTEEIVQVEVWAWTENHIYTEQKNKLEQEKKRTYTAVWLRDQNKFMALGGPEIPELRFQEKRNAHLALGINEEPYARYLTSEGTAHKDLYAIDMAKGQKKRIVTDLRCNPRISPEAGYIVWWSEPDTAWFSWNARTEAIARLSDNNTTAFYDEETDVPDYPNEHGAAAWIGKDEALILYDRFDLWKVDPSGKTAMQRLTRGRETQTSYRYIKLDPEERSIEPGSRILLHQSNETTKAQGYAWLDLKTGQLKPWISGDYSYARQMTKAKNAPDVLFTKENYQVFPDLIHTQIPDNQATVSLTGSTEKRISTANPQQNEYNWGSIELLSWTSLSGQALQGMLVKPADFDPAKQYPMIVNFYERQSDELHRHRSPDFHRSQINFTVYASKGYLVFVPDIVYKTGYPGESAYDAIMSGVTHLLDKGFVQRDKVALQGHSWGGYQSAYLITKTNLFACAESGAPVVNMTSAYGGIRWETGLSRAFQYEHQQSRIGGTLWEYPLRFLENSPLFSMDKVQTPVLILHNDKDGAVPWQQGIEMYSALRRLDKPCWLLNYNDEPHWPVKLQNRIDFQKRMMQFFDHYLMDAPAPRWMQRGVPPIEKGVLQGLELGKGQ